MCHVCTVQFFNLLIMYRDSVVSRQIAYLNTQSAIKPLVAKVHLLVNL